jgi:hypothetical protein
MIDEMLTQLNEQVSKLARENELLMQEIEQLKSNTIVNLDEVSGFTLYDPPHGAIIGNVEMLIWLVKNKSLAYWEMKASEK